MIGREHRWPRAVRAQIGRALASQAQAEDLLEALAALEALALALESGLAGESGPAGESGLAVKLDASRDAKPSTSHGNLLEVLDLQPAALRALRASGQLLLARTNAKASSSKASESEQASQAARSWARRGLSRLSGSPPSAADVLASVRPVDEFTLLRLVRGELDGFRAAEVASQARRHGPTRMELGLLLTVAADEADGRLSPKARPASASMPNRGPLLLAADGPTRLRDPSEGQPVGQLEGALALEAIRFLDGVVAIYASQPVAMALSSKPASKSSKQSSKPSVLPVGSAPGYLELRGLPARARGTRIRLDVDDAELELTVR